MILYCPDQQNPRSHVQKCLLFTRLSPLTSKLYVAQGKPNLSRRSSRTLFHGQHGSPRFFSLSLLRQDNGRPRHRAEAHGTLGRMTSSRGSTARAILSKLHEVSGVLGKAFRWCTRKALRYFSTHC